MTTGKQ